MKKGIRKTKPAKKKAAKKKGAKRKADRDDGKIVKTDTVIVEIRRTGETTEKVEHVEAVVFPEGVPLAQVGVEVNRSKEIRKNDWFGVRFTTTRNTVDTDAAVAQKRQQIFDESLDQINDLISKAIRGELE
jgi:hypothetical protein